LVKKYPDLSKYQSGLESLLSDIGMEIIGFPIIRNKSEDFAFVRYGIPSLPVQAPVPVQASPVIGAGRGGGTTLAVRAAVQSPFKKIRAVAINDSRAVRRALRETQPKGKNREKLVTLLKEARGLSLRDFPHSFCFVLRSMFELSAKAYCKDHAAAGGPTCTQAGGNDRNLVEVLRDITNHLTKNMQDKQMVKLLHGPMAELAKPNGFLSVTSMNQLIHNPKFAVDETHICTLFFNIFPLLEAMNK
jgi:hypothetical protein